MKYNYLNATGKLPYNMTNDYMFRMVLQQDKEPLINLICSILHIYKEQINNVRIDNPVEPGKSMTKKEYQMNIVVILNNNSIINLEMQVINYGNWHIRSLSYLSRKFNNILRGKDYDSIMPVYHIGFLDFTLFDDHPEFFAKYQMRNAKNNPSMNSTAEDIYVSNADEYIREECWLREERLAHEEYQKKQFEKLNNELSSLLDKNASLIDENATLSDENARLKKLLETNNIKF